MGVQMYRHIAVEWRKELCEFLPLGLACKILQQLPACEIAIAVTCDTLKEN